MRRLCITPLLLLLILFLTPAKLTIPEVQGKPDPTFHPVAWGNHTALDADGGPVVWWMGAGDRFGKLWIDGASKTWGKPWLKYGYCKSGYGAIDQWWNPNDYTGVERVEEADLYHTTWNLTTTGHPTAYIYSLQTAWYGYPWMKVDASYKFKSANTTEVRYQLTEAYATMYNFTIPKTTGYYGGTSAEIGVGEQKVYDNSTESLADNWIVVFDQGLSYIYVIALLVDPVAIYMQEWSGRWISVSISYGSVDGVPGQVVDLPPVYMGFYNRTHDRGAPFSSYSEMYQAASRMAHAMVAEPDYSQMSEELVSEGGGVAVIKKTMSFQLVTNDWGVTHEPLTPSCPWAQSVLNATVFSYEAAYGGEFYYVSGGSLHYELPRPRILFPRYGRPIFSSDERFDRLLNHTLVFVDGLKYHGLFWAGYWAPFFSRVGFTLDAMNDSYADTYWSTWISIQTSEADPHLQSWQSPVPSWLVPLVNNTWWRGYVGNGTTSGWEMSSGCEAGWEMWSTDYTPRILWGLYYHYLVSQNETYRAEMEQAVLKALSTLNDYSWKNPDFKAWYIVSYDETFHTWDLSRKMDPPGHESAGEEILAYYSGYLVTGDEDYLIKALKIHAMTFKSYTDSEGYPIFMGSLTVARIMPEGYRVKDLLDYGIQSCEYDHIRPGAVAGGTDTYNETTTLANTYYSACSLMAFMALGDVENATRFWRFLADAQEISEAEPLGTTGGICDGWNASTNEPIWGVNAVDTAGWILGGLSYTLNATVVADTLYFRVNIPSNWTRFRGYAKGEGQLVEYELEGEDEHLVFQLSAVSTIRYRLRQPERAIIRVKKEGKTIYNWRVEGEELVIPGLTGTEVEVFVVDPHPYIVMLHRVFVLILGILTSIVAVVRRRLGKRGMMLILAVVFGMFILLVVAAREVASLLI